MCTAKEALYLEHHLLRVDTMGRLVTTAGSKKSVPAKLQHQLTTIASSSPPPSTRTELVGHNELGVKNGHRSADLAGSIAARTRLQDALLLEEELKRSNRFCEQQNRLNKLKSTNGTDFDLCRNGPEYALVVQKPAAPTTAHLWSSLKVPKKLKGNDNQYPSSRRRRERTFIRLSCNYLPFAGKLVIMMVGRAESRRRASQALGFGRKEGTLSFE